MDDWNGSRLFVGIDIMSFELLVHQHKRLSYFYHSGIRANKSDFIKIGRPGVYLEEVFNRGNTVLDLLAAYSGQKLINTQNLNLDIKPQ